MSARMFAKFDCPACGRRVASLYAGDGLFRSVGPDSFLYAYLRAHKGQDGSACPAWHTGRAPG